MRWPPTQDTPVAEYTPVHGRKFWHRWFAWYPVVMTGISGHDHIVWLETIERKGTYHTYYGGDHWTWDYRGSG